MADKWVDPDLARHIIEAAKEFDRPADCFPITLWRDGTEPVTFADVEGLMAAAKKNEQVLN